MLPLRHSVVRLLTLLTAAALPVTALAAQNVADLQVTPEALTVKAGQSQSLFGQAFDGAGNIIATVHFSYRSQKPSVARVDGEGKVTGVSAGSTIIYVKAGRKSVSVSVLVTPGESPPPAAEPPVQHVAPVAALPPPPAGTQQLVIDPATVYLLQAESDHLVARALAADGTVLGPVRVIWRSLTPEVITVTDSLNGDVVGAAPGVGTIQAKLTGGLIATAPAQVVATNTPFDFRHPRLVLSPDQVDTLELVVPTQSNRAITAALTYASSNPAVAIVGPTGIVQAKGPGQTVITVTGYFQTRHLDLVVHRPIAYFLTDPASGGQVTVPLDGFRSVTAHAQAADSTPVVNAPLVWKVADTTIARYDTATGRVYGRKEGITNLTLSVRGYVPKVWGLRIVPGGIALDRKSLGMVVGSSAPFAVELRDARGTSFGPAPEVRWTSDHPDVATVTDGKVSAVGPGSALIIASVPWGKADTARVYVTGDFLLTSDRKTKSIPGIFQASLHAPDNLLPLATDSGTFADPALSPDRMQVAYAARTGGTDFDIWVMNADGTGRRRLTADSAAEVHPAWTPDGKSIIYTVVGEDRDQLWQMGADGTDRHPITPANISAGNPAVSPDGKWVAYVGGKKRKKPDVFLLRLGTDSSIAVTSTDEKETWVGWFPNGDLGYVTEASDGDRGYEVVRVPAGSTQRLFAATSAYPILSFAVSRDGNTIAWITQEPNEGDRQQKTKTVLYLNSLTPGSTPTAVNLPATELLGTPAF